MIIIIFLILLAWLWLLIISIADRNTKAIIKYAVLLGVSVLFLGTIGTILITQLSRLR